MTSTKPRAQVDTCIDIRGVHRSFPTRTATNLVLDDINLQITKGSFVTLFGPSGCGKTTLLRIMAGLQVQDDGEVSLFGQAPAQAARDKNLSWIPQSSALLPWRTAKKNSLLSQHVNRRADRRPQPHRVAGDALEILRQMGLSEAIDLRPHQLSGGMRQRVSLARGFVQGAPLMLMDEPFSALDEITRETLRYQLQEMWELMRKTVVFVTHSATEAVLLSDQVVVMSARPGRIQQVIDIDLPRPRPAGIEDAPEFRAKIAELRHAINEGWAS